MIEDLLFENEAEQMVSQQFHLLYKEQTVTEQSGIRLPAVEHWHNIDGEGRRSLLKGFPIWGSCALTPGQLFCKTQKEPSRPQNQSPETLLHSYLSLWGPTFLCEPIFCCRLYPGVCICGPCVTTVLHLPFPWIWGHCQTIIAKHAAGLSLQGPMPKAAPASGAGKCFVLYVCALISK